MSPTDTERNKIDNEREREREKNRVNSVWRALRKLIEVSGV